MKHHLERGGLSHPIHKLMGVLMFGAMRAAKQLSAGLDAVADDATSTMAARGGHRLDGAFKRIEAVLLTVLNDFKTFVVGVSASFTSKHGDSPVDGSLDGQRPTAATA